MHAHLSTFSAAVGLFLAFSIGSSAAPRGTIGAVSLIPDEMHGHEFAGGIRYDRTQLTATHADFAPGSTLEIVNLANGRRIIVTVIARHAVQGEVAGLSRAGAQRLGMLPSGKGVVRVILKEGAKSSPRVAVDPSRAGQLTPVSADTFRAPAPVAASEPPADHRFRLQFGAFQDPLNAQNLQQVLDARGIGASIQTGSGTSLHRVVSTTAYPSFELARQKAIRLFRDDMLAQPASVIGGAEGGIVSEERLP